MAVQTLYTAATGMQALETKLDVIANNLANVNTVGFKKDRANFEDLFYRTETLPGALDSAGQPTPTGIQIGLGSQVSSTQQNFTQGAFQQTGRQLDIAIEGPGFLQVTDPNGTIRYTRAGNLNINANGALVLGSADTGRLIDPPINIPQNAVNIVIDPYGSVSVQLPGQNQLSQVGQMQMAFFLNPEGLFQEGENLYSQTNASGQPTTGNPGNNGMGKIRQNMLEASNVEPVQELIDLITTQRSFELNSQVVQAGDQVLQLISNLRRF